MIADRAGIESTLRGLSLVPLLRPRGAAAAARAPSATPDAPRRRSRLSSPAWYDSFLLTRSDVPLRSRPAAHALLIRPGPMTPAVKWIIIANVALFVVTLFFRRRSFTTSGCPRSWFSNASWLWQLGTYMFLHGGAVHILFNMLGVWMFGVELERLWGTRRS